MEDARKGNKIILTWCQFEMKEAGKIICVNPLPPTFEFCMRCLRLQNVRMNIVCCCGTYPFLCSCARLEALPKLNRQKQQVQVPPADVPKTFALVRCSHELCGILHKHASRKTSRRNEPSAGASAAMNHWQRCWTTSNYHCREIYTCAANFWTLKAWDMGTLRGQRRFEMSMIVVI